MPHWSLKLRNYAPSVTDWLRRMPIFSTAQPVNLTLHGCSTKRCLVLRRRWLAFRLAGESAARDWLEGTTDEAGAEIPDDITVAGLQAWFDSQMVSNDGKSGFLTRAEAEEAIKKACPATDRIVAGIKADGVEQAANECYGAGYICETLLAYAQQLREGPGNEHRHLSQYRFSHSGMGIHHG